MINSTVDLEMDVLSIVWNIARSYLGEIDGLKENNNRRVRAEKEQVSWMRRANNGLTPRRDIFSG